MHAWIVFVAAGVGVGVAFGLFGEGGSAFATPVLALLGVPPAIAVASPLPAMLPASLGRCPPVPPRGSVRSWDSRAGRARRSPGGRLGSAASRFVGGTVLLALSGLLLFGLGVRMVWPSGDQAEVRGATST